MKHESQRPEEVQPADRQSIEVFLSAVEENVATGHLDEKTGTRSLGFTLPDGRRAHLMRAGIVAEDLEPDRAIATLLVNEKDGDDVIQTSYQHYKDGRMERGLRVLEDLGPVYVDLLGKGIVSQEKGQELLTKIDAFLEVLDKEKESEQAERALGLRVATEADMREAEEIFRLLEEAQKDAG